MRPTDPAKINDALERYRTGETFQQAAAALGIGQSALQRAAKRAGVEVRSRRIELDGVALLYESGVSEFALSEQFGVARDVIRRHLIEAEVQPRGNSDAQILRFAQMTIEERRALAAPSHDAVRGKQASETQLVKAAQARELRPRQMSAGERRLKRMLSKRGICVQREKAIGRYNVDFAIADVAVEVLGGKWHGYNAKHAARTKAILDAGWHVVFVWDHDRVAVGDGAASYIVGFIEEASRHPSSVRKYRVIRGDGQFVAGGNAKDYNLTSIAPARKTPRRRRVNKSVA